jgi:hypothetical protein
LIVGRFELLAFLLSFANGASLLWYLTECAETRDDKSGGEKLVEIRR